MLSHFSCVQLFVVLWTVACQAPLFLGFSRQEYWSGLPRPPSGDLTNPEIEPASLISPTLANRFLTTSATWKVQVYNTVLLIIYICAVYSFYYQNKFILHLEVFILWPTSPYFPYLSGPDSHNYTLLFHGIKHF